MEINPPDTNSAAESEKRLSEIQLAIEQLDYQLAGKLINSYKKNMAYGEEIAVLEAELFISTGKPEYAVSCIQKGLSYNSSNYELYLMLGEVYEMIPNQECAELCYRYSVYQCHNHEDLPFLKENLNRFLQKFGSTLPKISVLLNITENIGWLKSCIQLISLFVMPDSYEIICLGSEISEVLRKWLDEQKIDKFVFCGVNCTDVYNMGIEAADSLSDILVIDEGGLPLEHTLFNLQLALYHDRDTGASGSFSNAPSGHRYLKQTCPTMQDAMTYAHSHNIPDSAHMVSTLDLPGPLYLFKRTVLKQYGWFDSGYTLTAYQKKDLFFRLLHHNKKVLLCTNCFAAVSSEMPFSLDSDNLNRFYEQWKVNLTYSCHARYDLINIISEKQALGHCEPPLSVLEVGCACGSTLIEIGRLFPGSRLYGIELDDGPASIAKHFASISNEDIEKANLNYPENYFDYIIFGDVLEHLRAPEAVLHVMKKYLKSDGKILASIPNVMHISVIKPLLNGFWSYEDAGILDRTHLKFFTYREIQRMFQNEGYFLEEISATVVPISDEDSELISGLAKLQNVPENWFHAYQYLVCAQKKESNSSQ